MTWHEWLKCAGCKVRQSIFSFNWVIQSVADRSVFPCRDTLIGPVRAQRLCSIKKTTTKEHTFCCSIKCLTHSWHKQQLIFRYFFYLNNSWEFQIPKKRFPSERNRNARRIACGVNVRFSDFGPRRMFKTGTQYFYPDIYRLELCEK